MVQKIIKTVTPKQRLHFDVSSYDVAFIALGKETRNIGPWNVSNEETNPRGQKGLKSVS